MAAPAAPAAPAAATATTAALRGRLSPVTDVGGDARRRSACLIADMPAPREERPRVLLMLQGFKEFIMKGNVVDLAVAVVIGAAFAQVVNALVDAVLMPLISALVGSPSFDQFLVLDINGNAIKFGVLLTAIVNFLLIAAAVYFAIVLPMNKLIERRNRRLGIDPDAEELTADQSLLTEIRDLLAEGRRDSSGPRL